ncbi:MAG: energy transducer TonB [Acidobacteriia bacterium]|nr:energy transducer TonB [Terriglobia bacterium]
MNRLLTTLFLVLTAGSVGASAQSTDPSKAEPLPPPQQKAPVNNAQVPASAGNFVRLEWAPVDGAATYGVEIDCFSCCDHGRWCSETSRVTHSAWMVDSPYSYSMPAGRSGSWRVWAVDKAGHPGKVSDWSVFLLADSKSKDVPARPPKTSGPPPGLPQPMVMRVEKPVDTTTGEPCTGTPPNPPPKDITFPKHVYTPEPEYGEISRKAHVNGGARVLIQVGADGSVKRACLLEAVQPDLGEQSVKAVRRWRFQPARKNGEPFSYEMLVETSFTIFTWK